MASLTVLILTWRSLIKFSAFADQVLFLITLMLGSFGDDDSVRPVQKQERRLFFSCVLPFKTLQIESRELPNSRSERSIAARAPGNEPLYSTPKVCTVPCSHR